MGGDTHSLAPLQIMPRVHAVSARFARSGLCTSRQVTVFLYIQATCHPLDSLPATLTLTAYTQLPSSVSDGASTAVASSTELLSPPLHTAPATPRSPARRVIICKYLRRLLTHAQAHAPHTLFPGLQVPPHSRLNIKYSAPSSGLRQRTSGARPLLIHGARSCIPRSNLRASGLPHTPAHATRAFSIQSCGGVDPTTRPVARAPSPAPDIKPTSRLRDLVEFCCQRAPSTTGRRHPPSPSLTATPVPSAPPPPSRLDSVSPESSSQQAKAGPRTHPPHVHAR
ncbi:uncharacterized protein C8Q71DRAFT_559379 [Rhodofomes roseus]|uniref:Uncharacterized protein n=1 Tax=Rhodofomes roseus TaxID=34475 RepID=A0ABQ8KIF0_9APHY|nr:uncharacterized protein C8Q71DRAFT_559379 [Rhodofomes roseus]KAH9837748.1 hypothetical protein C8Q71DRAFT_559379 [Rhodofomes roseus]